MSLPKPLEVSCRKCGRKSPPPVLSDEAYGGRWALFWECSDQENCGYAWTKLIYDSPADEIIKLQRKIIEMERADRRLRMLTEEIL